MSKEVIVPKHIIESARLAQEYIRKSRTKIDQIEEWLERNGINVDFLREKDVILPHIENEVYNIEHFQRDLNQFVIRYVDEEECYKL